MNHLETVPHAHLWKNHLPLNWSLMSNRLGTAALNHHIWAEGETYREAECEVLCGDERETKLRVHEGLLEGERV